MNGYIRGEKGVATALAYIVKGVGYLKTPCVFRHRQVEGIGFRLPLKTFTGYIESGCW